MENCKICGKEPAIAIVFRNKIVVVRDRNHCAKCGCKLNLRREYETYHGMGRACYGTESPRICMSCYKKWAKEVYEPILSHQCSINRHSYSDIWKIEFEKWIGYKWGFTKDVPEYFSEEQFHIGAKCLRELGSKPNHINHI